MTKKSTARLERDRQEQEQKGKEKEFQTLLDTNHAWDELHQIHQGILSQIQNFGGLTTLVDNKALYPFIQNPTVLAETFQTLALDISNIKTEIKTLYDQFKDSKGGARTEDEYFSSINLYMAYATIVERVEGILLPSFGQIMEIFVKAEADYQIHLVNNPQEEVKAPEVLTPLTSSQTITPTKDLAGKLHNERHHYTADVSDINIH